MHLINCEINLYLNWSKICFIVANNADKCKTFSITDTKHYIPVATLSTQDNTKLLKVFKSSFKRKINWNKYQSKFSTERQNQYLYFSLDPGFQGVNRLFVLSFEDIPQKITYKRYYLRAVEMKNY